MHAGEDPAPEGPATPLPPPAEAVGVDGRRALRPVATIGVLLAAAWPVVEMTRFVRRGTHLPWGDYWMMVDTLFRDDGANRLAGYLQFHNDHPVVFAKVMFWLNLRIGDGSNITLGHVVILVALAQVLLVRHLLTRSPLTFVERSLILVLVAALLFSMNGSWSFTKSMSGAAWLTANLFAVAAITLRQRDHPWLSGSAAAMAMISYGTGLSAWPAVAAVGLARRPWREWWRELPMAAGTLLGYLWYQAESHRPTGYDPTLGRLASTVVTLLTAPLRGDLRGLSILAVIVAGGLGALAIWRTDRDAAPWLGLAVYGLASTTTIAFGRWQLIQDEPVSRYHSLAALFWIGATGLVVFAVRERVLGLLRTSPQPRRLLALGAAAVVVVAPMLTLSWDVTDDVAPGENLVTRQELAAAALRLGLGDDFQWATGWKEDIDMDSLRRRGHYPYSSRWDDDCGLLGDTLDVDRMPVSPFGVLAGTAPATLPGGVALDADVPDVDSIRCIVAVAPDGEVVGVGVLDDSSNFGVHADGARGAVVVALDDQPSYRVAVFADRYPSGTVLADRITSAQITRP